MLQASYLRFKNSLRKKGSQRLGELWKVPFYQERILLPALIFAEGNRLSEVANPVQWIFKKMKKSVALIQENAFASIYFCICASHTVVANCRNNIEKVAPILRNPHSSPQYNPRVVIKPLSPQYWVFCGEWENKCCRAGICFGSLRQA